LGRYLAATASLALVLAGCQGENGTPGAGTGVALDMVVKRVGCHADPRATACFRITITNRGYSTGGGSCVLTGVTHGTTYPGDTSESGQRFSVSRLAPGASITRHSIWRAAKRDFYYGICDPGMRS